MTMSAENKTDEVKSTGRRYESIDALMRGEGVAKEIQDAVADLERETQLTKQLATIRAAAGLTQEQMAEKLGFSQSCISKWESGRDEDLDIKTIRAYSEVTGQRMGILIGKPLNHVEAIKLHVAAFQKRLLSLAALANQDQELESEINKFFAEACLNIFGILARCQQELPANSSGVEVRIQMIDERPSHPKRRSSSVQPETQPA
jgi:transcriptional regulator with XRE-family HTH domain